MEPETPKSRYPLERDYVLCPGETLAEWFEHVAGISPHVARRVGTIDEDQLERLLAGVEPLTDDLAARLQRLTRIPASFWLSLETNYRNGLRAGLHHVHDT